MVPAPSTSPPRRPAPDSPARSPRSHGPPKEITKAQGLSVGYRLEPGLTCRPHSGVPRWWPCMFSYDLIGLSRYLWHIGLSRYLWHNEPGPGIRPASRAPTSARRSPPRDPHRGTCHVQLRLNPCRARAKPNEPEKARQFNGLTRGAAPTGGPTRRRAGATA